MGHYILPTLNQRELIDHDIMELQNLFLTRGFHSLTVSSLLEGRIFLLNFLETLSCYSSVCCLSLSGDVPSSVFSLSHFFLEHHMFGSHHVIDSYLLQDFYFDFFWIEGSRELIEMEWFSHLRSRLFDFNIVDSLPIVFLEQVRSAPSSRSGALRSR